MIESTVIIVGGGPAGSACARELKKNGIETLIIDRQVFPRTKLCAGWITPGVFNLLELIPKDYPHSLRVYRELLFYFKDIPVLIPTHQYAIRRLEFDNFLLKRADVPVYRHRVKNISKAGDSFVIDNKYRCNYLVGAGGTHCPVYKELFFEIYPRNPADCIATVEEEFAWQWNDPRCRLWFFDRGLPGYAWYVPKENGYLNTGIGGKLSVLKKRGETINTHWRRFVKKLARDGLAAGRKFFPKGHIYFIRGKTDNASYKNAFIIGDAAGLATRDMGEGIGPAIESGIRAARSIVTGKPFSLASISKYSAPQILTGRFKKNIWYNAQIEKCKKKI